MRDCNRRWRGHCEAGGTADPFEVARTCDQHEGERERNAPCTPFQQIAAVAVPAALREPSVPAQEEHGHAPVDAVPDLASVPDTSDTRTPLKMAGCRIALISNTDDALVAGNVARLGGHVDAVVTAEQALATLEIGLDQTMHVCASSGARSGGST